MSESYTPEQEVRDILERMGVDGAQNFTAGEVGELAQLIMERRILKYWVTHREDADDDEEEYFDDYVEEGELVTPPQEEVLPAYFSEKMRQHPGDAEKKLSSATFYLWGYTPESPIEELLDHARISFVVNAVGEIWALEDIQLVPSAIGTAYRFEVVSNSDLFYYFGGGVGTSFAAPMCMTHRGVVPQQPVHINNLTISI